MKEALYYEKLAEHAVRCTLCPHECTITDGKKGICGVRENAHGILYANTYAMLSALALDPVEKKPLNRFKPGSQILSVGTYGCNFACDFCQNYHIAQRTPPLKHVDVDRLLDKSDHTADNIGIAFTYNEPTIWYEYVLDVAKNNHKDTVLVTNGYINKAPLTALLPYIDAMNIDLKAIDNKFYKTYCKGKLSPVQKTIALAAKHTHVELTFLAIPELNDSEEKMEKMADWIAGVDKNLPLHIIGFRPMHRMMHVPYQTEARIAALKNIAAKKLTYVY